MKITLDKLKELYNNRTVTLGRTFEVYANGNTATDTNRLAKATIHVDADDNSVAIECFRTIKTRNHADRCCNCGYKPTGYSFGVRLTKMGVDDIETVYITENEDITNITLIGKYRSIAFEVYN